MHTGLQVGNLYCTFNDNILQLMTSGEYDLPLASSICQHRDCFDQSDIVYIVQRHIYNLLLTIELHEVQ